jgi:hypothetical protein
MRFLRRSPVQTPNMALALALPHRSGLQSPPGPPHQLDFGRRLVVPALADASVRRAQPGNIVEQLLALAPIAQL